MANNVDSREEYQRREHSKDHHWNVWIKDDQCDLREEEREEWSVVHAPAGR